MDFPSSKRLLSMASLRSYSFLSCNMGTEVPSLADPANPDLSRVETRTVTAPRDPLCLALGREGAVFLFSHWFDRGCKVWVEPRHRILPFGVGSGSEHKRWGLRSRPCRHDQRYQRVWATLGEDLALITKVYTSEGNLFPLANNTVHAVRHF